MVEEGVYDADWGCFASKQARQDQGQSEDISLESQKSSS